MVECMRYNHSESQNTHSYRDKCEKPHRPTIQLDEQCISNQAFVRVVVLRMKRLSSIQ
jgi:hypothetical protein